MRLRRFVLLFALLGTRACLAQAVAAEPAPNPFWADQGFTSYAVSCTQSIFPRSPDGTLLPEVESPNIIRGIRLRWLAGSKLYTMQLQAPRKIGVLSSVPKPLLFKKMVTRLAIPESPNWIQREVSELFNLKSSQITRTTTTVNWTTQIIGEVLAQQSEDNQSVLNLHVQDLGADSRLVTSTQETNDAILGYKIFRRVANCRYQPTTLEQAKLDPEVLTAVQRFTQSFIQVGSIRQAWLQCLEMHSAGDCQEIHDRLLVTEQNCDEQWQSLLSPESLPPRPLLTQAVELPLIPQSAPVGSVQNVPSDANEGVLQLLQQAPFTIPNRQCRYVRRADVTLAYCDGGALCEFNGKGTSVSCSDGMSCKLTEQKVTCK